VLSEPTPSKDKTAQEATTPSIPSLYSPAEIERILKEAQHAQKLMQEHQKHLDATLSGT
jgi:hypothetical protein